jgi:hypothetical protein
VSTCKIRGHDYTQIHPLPIYVNTARPKTLTT